MTERYTQVVVIGAGAAGLAAARRLHERGIDFLLIEARERAGGRAYTASSAHGSYPIELGAEFIHGAARSTRALMREIGEEAVPSSGERFRLRAGHLEPVSDRWESTERLLLQVDVTGPDRSVAAFLDAIPPDELSPAQRADACALVEGFDAALVEDASIIGIAREWRSGVNDTSHRPLHGYAPVIGHLAQAVGDRLLLQTVATAVRWEPHRVTIDATSQGAPLRVHAQRAIVTMPIGVLRAGTGIFSPALPPEKRDAIERIAMGPVIKVALEFRDAFWERLENGRYRDAAFFQVEESPLRTMWVRYPDRSPVLMGWAGGGAVLRLREQTVDPIRAALDTAARLFPTVDVAGELLETYFHDWDSDPFALGAYSYLRVGAGNARERLAEPISDTLFFAGEAASSDDAGTVAGAFDSGYSSGDRVAK